MEPGFYPADQLDNETYHRGAGISQSALKILDQSPEHLRAYLDGLRGSKETPGKFMGTAVHAAALEPEVFDAQYVVAPEEFGARNAKGFKAWKEEQDPRQTILMHYENQKVKAMHDKLHGHPWVGPRLRGATCELSCFANDPETGVLCRVRYDMVTEDGWVLDLKKCQDARQAAVSKSIANYGYYMQDAFYSDVPGWLGPEYRPRGFVFVFIEEEPPHAVKVWALASGDRDRGRREYRRLLNIYAECLEADEWPGYSTDPEVIELPGWKRSQLDFIQSEEL